MPSKQETTFLNSEADQWYLRNKEALRQRSLTDDKVTQFILDSKIKPKSILEVGCANGFRLNFLQEKLGAQCFGVDPSQKAIEDGQELFPKIQLEQGTAASLPYQDGQFDLVIYGFLLYLCDRSDLFKIASEADRVLANLGHIVLFDFYTNTSYKNEYNHLKGVYSYKMQNSKMFLWNPGYMLLKSQILSASGTQWSQDVDDTTALELLHKNSAMGFPANPFRKDTPQ